MGSGAQLFERQKRAKGTSEEKEKAELFEQIGRLKMELEWLKKKIGDLELDKRRVLIDPAEATFSQRKQCQLLGLHRSGLYYEPRGPTEKDLQLMLAIDKQYLQTPFYGRRRMTIAMRNEGFFVGQKKARTVMQTMGLEAIYPKPNLSKPD